MIELQKTTPIFAIKKSIESAEERRPVLNKSEAAAFIRNTGNRDRSKPTAPLWKSDAENKTYLNAPTQSETLANKKDMKPQCKPTLCRNNRCF